MMRLFIFLIFSVCAKAFAADPLPALGASASGITASGLSSGGFMAVQLHVAHSAIVKGAGLLARGPYYFAHGSLWTPHLHCPDPRGFAPPPPPAAPRAPAH